MVCLPFNIIITLFLNWQQNLPVNTNGTQIKNAGCTHHDVQGDKHITMDFTEAPLPHHLQHMHIHAIRLQKTSSIIYCGQQQKDFTGK